MGGGRHGKECGMSERDRARGRRSKGANSWGLCWVLSVYPSIPALLLSIQARSGPLYDHSNKVRINFSENYAKCGRLVRM